MILWQVQGFAFCFLMTFIDVLLRDLSFIDANTLTWGPYKAHNDTKRTLPGRITDWANTQYRTGTTWEVRFITRQQLTSIRWTTVNERLTASDKSETSNFFFSFLHLYPNGTKRGELNYRSLFFWKCAHEEEHTFSGLGQWWYCIVISCRFMSSEFVRLMKLSSLVIGRFGDALSLSVKMTLAYGWLF